MPMFIGPKMITSWIKEHMNDRNKHLNGKIIILFSRTLYEFLKDNNKQYCTVYYRLHKMQFQDQ